MKTSIPAVAWYNFVLIGRIHFLMKVDVLYLAHTPPSIAANTPKTVASPNLACQETKCFLLFTSLFKNTVANPKHAEKVPNA